MIYFHKRQWGSEVQFSIENDGNYQSAYVRDVQWLASKDVPEELVLGEQTFRQRWEMPTSVFYSEPRHRNDHHHPDRPKSLVEVYVTYHRRIVRSTNEKIRALTFVEWLSINPMKEYGDKISAIEILIDAKGQSWLVKIRDQKLVIEQLTENLVISGMKIHTVNELVARRRAWLEQALVNLDMMTTLNAKQDHLIGFDDHPLYSNKEQPFAMSRWLENLLERY